MRLIKKKSEKLANRQGESVSILDILEERLWSE